VWDLRVLGRPLTELRGHSFAVRRLRYSPHAGEHLASASYDTTVAVWNVDAPAEPLLYAHERHSEFVCGLDFNLYLPGQLATASWDETVHLFTPPCFL
jgi:peroxin-7